MNIAYLILAHKNPKHLQRLITALSSSSSAFFIHIDKKSNFDDFLRIQGNNLQFTKKRVSVYLEDFSLVKAILILLQTAFVDGRHFDRFVLLSGVDYPIRSASFIERYFESNPDKEFISLVEMPSESGGKPISRLTAYQPRFGGRFKWITITFRRVLTKIGILPRERDYMAYLRDLAPYGGSTWWALSRDACEYVLTFVKKETRIVNFFANTICPDESFFQTILGNSHFMSRIVKSLTYADWSAGEAHPEYISEKHLAFFQSIPYFAPDGVDTGRKWLFARKFPDNSDGLVTKLQSQIN